MHGTCAAQACAATKFGSGHAEFIAKNPQQRGVCVGVGINGLTVDLKLKAHKYFLGLGMRTADILLMNLF
jgi:hypothetical protein